MGLKEKARALKEITNLGIKERARAWSKKVAEQGTRFFRWRALWQVLGIGVAAFCLGGGIYAWAEKEVLLKADGEVRQVKTFAPEVASFLAAEGIELGPSDRVSPPLDFSLRDGLTVTVERAFAVAVWVGGTKKEVLTPPATVKEVLERAGVGLGPADRLSVPLERQVEPGMEIGVTRVTSAEISRDREIPFRVEQRKDPALGKGQTQLIREGKRGLAREIIRVTYENGREVKREVISQEVLRKPVNKLVAFGTRQVVSRGGESLNFQKVLSVLATAYSPAAGRYTARGTVARRGSVAVDPQVIPLGTRLYVDQYGHGVAEDVGSAIKGERVDVFFPTEAEARRWGVRRVNVYLLN